MELPVEHRPSDSPYIERVWRSGRTAIPSMMAVANPYWDLVVWEERGRMRAAIQGPESKASPAPVPEDAPAFGITFSLGTVLHQHPAAGLVDDSVELPDVTRRRVRLGGSGWCLPDYDNAEAFIERLVREDVLARDPIVAAALDDHRPPPVSLRTVQRRFLATTGLTRTAVGQIVRAREAAVLISEGRPASEVTHLLGYFDQPHLTRSLARYIGRTARGLRDPGPLEPLSLLYKT